MRCRSESKMAWSSKVSRALLAAALILSSAAADARSRHARAEFVKHHPCPTTGKARGACPGWQVDHVVPLGCGGADTPGNMQWLTVTAHKAKTRAERAGCLRRMRTLLPSHSSAA
jgi:5-methylcytosine-specific restriction endonuclease McrA